MRKLNQNAFVSTSLEVLTAAALALPGLSFGAAMAGDTEFSTQYGHYQEGNRQLYNNSSNLKPIEVETLHNAVRFKLAERVKFSFSYIQDTWSGATPITTAPLAFGGNRKSSVSGASPLFVPDNLLRPGKILLDSGLNPLLADPVSGRLSGNNQLVHTLSSASPETRKQGDFKLGYEWDEAAIDLGGGLSLENDYESRFANLGGRMDFNQKLTTLLVDVNYTNSDTLAVLDHDALPYIYETSTNRNSNAYNASRTNSQLIRTGSNNPTMKGNREDWSPSIGLTQVINKNAILRGTFQFTHSEGYLSNPYKSVTTLFIDPNQRPDSNGYLLGAPLARLENRPDERNQFSFAFNFIQHVDYFDAALHADYRLFHDDWGITAHTFQLDWAQPFADDWLVTPRIRYYSQDAADFYQPYVVSMQAAPGKLIGVDSNNNAIVGQLNADLLPAHYSSDQRLSGFGALSGGITITKQFAKGFGLEVGAEYYTHVGALKLGGGGEGAYADYDSFLVNASLKVDMSALSQLGSGMSMHHHHHHAGMQHSAMTSGHHHSHAPAGVMFDHVLPKAGDFMVGYRYLYSFQGGGLQQGTAGVSDSTLVNQACYGPPCYIAPEFMNMSMHMLDLMYAPTDWLTLMLMPQFMDMDMEFRSLEGAPNRSTTDSGTSAAIKHAEHPHNTGGVGDTSLYALFKVYEHAGHHITASIGFSVPTGDSAIRLRDTHGVALGFIHYGMQLGSGTWDFKPSLTYTGSADDWSWGAQLSGTKRLEAQNDSGFAFGDILQTTAWTGYQINPWLSASVRGIYTLQGTNSGSYNDVYRPIGPMDYSQNYGGRFWDVGLGLSVSVPSGELQGNRLSFEWLQPVEDDVNGYQLPREGALSATWSYAF